MGNASRKAFESSEPRRPGKPRARLVSPQNLLKHRLQNVASMEGFESVSDEICLKWSPSSRLRRDLGYEIEMWDIGLQEWVRVAEAEGCQCILANILSGIMYRFRVRAVNGDGQLSEPSEPSDPFVIDLPGVNIAPYWIHTPAPEVSLTMGQTLRLRARALGTPKPSFHWYKDSQELFVDNRVSIQTLKDDETQITVVDVEPDDSGVLKCAAINLMGKCVWETKVDINTSPAFTIPGSLKKTITCAQDEMLRIKIPIVSMPKPTVTLERLDNSNPWDRRDVRVHFRNNFVIFQIDNAQINHSGRWKITATNTIGSDSAIVEVFVTGVPSPPSTPEIEELAADSVRLTWTDKSADDIWTRTSPISYRVEYNRESWEIWLRGCVVTDKSCVISGLIPGSFYRFRVRAITRLGAASEPSQESEPIFLGAPLEDEVYGLPGGNYPREYNGGRGRLHHYGSCRNSKHFGSWSNLDASQSESLINHQQISSAHNRQMSLDRDVFYFDNDRRQEVVNYNSFQLGSTAKKFGLSQEEESIYKRSLGNLASQMIRVSREKLNKDKQFGSKLSVEKVLQRIETSSVDGGKSSSPKFDLSLQDKRKLEVSLTDLCQKLKAVSTRDLSYSDLRGQRGFSEGPGNYLRNRPPLRKALSCQDAHKALDETCSRISSMQSLLIRPLSPIPLSCLPKIDLTERYMKMNSFNQNRSKSITRQATVTSTDFESETDFEDDVAKVDQDLRNGYGYSTNTDESFSDPVESEPRTEVEEEDLQNNLKNFTQKVLSLAKTYEEEEEVEIDNSTREHNGGLSEYNIENQLLPVESEDEDKEMEENNLNGNNNNNSEDAHHSPVPPVRGTPSIPCSPMIDTRSTSRASEFTLLCSFDETDGTSRTLVENNDNHDSDNYLSDFSCDNL